MLFKANLPHFSNPIKQAYKITAGKWNINQKYLGLKDLNAREIMTWTFNWLRRDS